MRGLRSSPTRRQTDFAPGTVHPRSAPGSAARMLARADPARTDPAAAQRRAVAADHVHPDHPADRTEPAADRRLRARTAVDRFVPAVMMVAMMSTAFTGQAIAVGFDRRYGALKRLGATPLPRWGIIGGQIAAVVIVVVLQAILLGLIGVALGWRPSIAGLLLGAVVIAIGTAPSRRWDCCSAAHSRPRSCWRWPNHVVRDARRRQPRVRVGRSAARGAAASPDSCRPEPRRGAGPGVRTSVDWSASSCWSVWGGVAGWPGHAVLPLRSRPPGTGNDAM